MAYLFRTHNCLREGVALKRRKYRASPYAEPQCIACGEEILDGEQVARVPIGPGACAKARQHALAGEWFDAVSVQVHWACSGFREIT